MQPRIRERPAIEPPVVDDRRLVTEVLAKDRKATAEFVARCADCVYPFVRRRLLPEMSIVDDLVQEILLAAWQNLPNFRGQGKLEAWFLGIARHKVEDHYRKRIRETELDEQAQGLSEPAESPFFEEQLDSEAQRHNIEVVLAALPEAYRLALLWRYHDNRSAREMAELTGKTEKAIERLLARARASFRQRWRNVRR